MLKKMLCATVAVAIGLSCGTYADENKNSGIAEANRTENEQFIGFNLLFDDSKEDYGFDIISNKNSATKTEGIQNGGLQTAKGHYSKIFDRPIKSGTYRYSFDFCDNKNDPAQGLTRVFCYAQDTKVSRIDMERMYEGFTLISNNVSSYENHNTVKTGGRKIYAMSKNKGEYTGGEWVHIDFYYDLDNGFTYLYLNDKFISKEKIGYEIKDIYGIDFSVEKGSCIIDNYKFEKLDYSLETQITKSGGGIPEELVDPLGITFEETSFAYNYFGNTAEIIINLHNQTDDAREFELTYNAIDDNGFEVWEKSEKISLNKDEFKRHTIKADIGRFGLYTMHVTAKADGVEFQSSKKHKFTLIKAPESGIVNQETAIHELFSNDRQQHGGYQKQILSMYEKAGFWGTRSAVVRNGIKNWQSWQDGMPIDYDYYKPSLDYIKDSRMETMLTLSGSNVSFDHIPVTEDELKDFYAFCYRVAADTKDYVNIYEIWNEPNESFFNVNATPEQYAEALKTASIAVKAANPNAKIAGVALSGTGAAYAERVLKAANGCIDYVTVHPYMWMQSPEKGGLVSKVEEIIKVMEKYGLSRDKLWFGEVGFYSHVGYENMAAYTTQMFLLKDAYDLASKIFIFRYTDAPSLPREGFGLVNAIIDREPFMARKAFLTMSAYNALMTDNTPNGIIDYDDNQKLYRFKLRDGRDCIVMWNNDEKREISLNLGCDSAVVYDACGNSNTVYGIKQKYQFSCGGLPIYVTGNFSKVEKCDNLFDVDKDVLKIVNGDGSELTVKNLSGMALNAKFETTAEILTEKEAEIGSEPKKIPITAGDISKNAADAEVKSGQPVNTANIDEIYNDYENGLRMSLYSDGKLVYSKQLEVECVNPIDVTHFSKHYSGEWWEYVVDITNNMCSTELGGKINISSPISFAKNLSEWGIDKIKPGETKRIQFPIPDLLDKSDLNFKAKIEIDNGYSVDISRELSFRAIPKNRKKPKIDGVIEFGEWNEKYAINITEKSGKYLPLINQSFGGDADLSAKTYFEFDDENLYFAARVIDDVQKEDAARGIWAGDSIQLGFALERSLTAPYTELNFGFKNDKAEISRSSSLVGQLVAVDIPHKLVIKRDESKKETIYELMMPLNEVYPANFKIKNTSSVSFSVLINDRDSDEHNIKGEGREGMLEYGSGIGSGKDPSKFLEFNLVR